MKYLKGNQHSSAEGKAILKEHQIAENCFHIVQRLIFWSILIDLFVNVSSKLFVKLKKIRQL